MIRDFKVIQSQQLSNGLLIAGGGDYDKIWIRDNAYVALAFLEAGQFDDAAKILNELCKIISTFQDRLTATNYPENDSALLPPRFTTQGKEVSGHWSNKQHDAVGVLLFAIGRLFKLQSNLITDETKQTIRQLVTYLETCRYWEDTDNGIWEEAPPILHSSSLAACIRGIEKISGFVDFDKDGLQLAKDNLEKLLPNESEIHPVDMALLSLIWPYEYKRHDIVERIEDQLLRKHGVIRHIGDEYEAGGISEPEWVMGIPWLGIAHFEFGDVQKAKQYLEITERLYTENGLPESYLADNTACVHTPLAWSHAMAIVLRSKLADR